MHNEELRSLLSWQITSSIKSKTMSWGRHVAPSDSKYTQNLVQLIGENNNIKINTSMK
jgi:hypothetical protein